MKKQKRIKRDLTLIYSDSAEKAAFTPIYDEAEKRGYSVRLSDDKFCKCEIAIYCQHINFPQYSKFSIIMLHDLTQQYGRWPDIWYLEPWNKYDIGILPSDQWEKNWNKCSQWYYANPRLGMYKIGWPKADLFAETDVEKYRRDFYQKYNLDSSKKTILYAPAWENDGKEDSFLNSVRELDVNILIKHWDADPNKYPQQVKNVELMRLKHEKIDNVTILPPSTNIFSAIAVSDVLVSEESSTMCEATMMGIPAVSVSDWLIPDTVPSRLPSCNYDFVYKTTQEKLHSTIDDILNNYETYKNETVLFASKNFCNIGNVSKMIMDIIDDCVDNKSIRYNPINPNKKIRVPFMKDLRRRRIQFNIQMKHNYCVKSPLLNAVWDFGRNIKNSLVRH